MSGVDVIPDGSKRPRRQKHAVSAPTITAETQSLLASLSERHRKTKRGFKFDSLTIGERKEFYEETTDYVLKCPEARNLTSFQAASRVALRYNIIIADHDRGRIKATVCNRLKVAMLSGQYANDIPSEAATADIANGQQERGEKLGARERDVDDDKLPSSKVQRTFKGASNRIEYKDILKEEALAAALRLTSKQSSGEPSTISLNKVFKDMRLSLAAKGIEVSKSTCRTHVKTALANNWSPADASEDPAQEDLAPAPIPLSPMPENIQEAIDFINKGGMRYDDGQVTYEQVVANNIRLQESSRLVVEYFTARAEKPKADKTITITKTMLDLYGSAAGEVDSRMEQARNEENQTEKAVEAVRNEESKQKNALLIAAGVIRGAELLQALELHGERLFSTLTLPDMQALLTNSDPHGNVTKVENITEGMLRIRALASVKAALSRCVLAVAVGDPPSIPYVESSPAANDFQPPPPFLSFEADIDAIPSPFRSFGSPGTVRYPFCPVDPEAP